MTFWWSSNAPLGLVGGVAQLNLLSHLCDHIVLRYPALWDLAELRYASRL